MTNPHLPCSGSNRCSPNPRVWAVQRKLKPCKAEGCMARGWSGEGHEMSVQLLLLHEGQAAAGEVSCSSCTPCPTHRSQPHCAGSGTGAGSASRPLPEHAALPLGRDRHCGSNRALPEQLCLGSFKHSLSPQWEETWPSSQGQEAKMGCAACWLPHSPPATATS